MYTTLLAQQWKKTVRSKYFSQGWGIKLLIIFLVLYFGLSFLFLGIFLPEIIEEARPDATSVSAVFGEFLLHYILVDLAMRFFFQDLSVLSVKHYLLHPVKKGKVVNFLLTTSIFNFFNLFPLLFIVPFAIRGVAPEMGAGVAIMWLIAMLGLVKFDHYLAIYLKRIMALNMKVFAAFAIIVAGLLIADFMEWFDLNPVSTLIFSGLGSWWMILVISILAFAAYALNFSFLRKQLYLDRWTNAKKEARTQEFSFLESKGVVGTMMANELKLILRHKRTRSILVMTGLFMFYGLLFYSGAIEAYEGMAMQVFAGIFMTGIFMINYGQFLTSWEGGYFDGILTRAYPMESYFRAKLWLLVGSSVITYIISLAYVFFTINALWVNTACFLYNIGVNSFILMYASTYQKKKIDLTQGSAFNYQGTSAVQFLVAIPLLIIPIIIYKSFDVFGAPYYGLATLAILGLLSLACQKFWFKGIIENFNEKKYRNAQGFREG